MFWAKLANKRFYKAKIGDIRPKTIKAVKIGLVSSKLKQWNCRMPKKILTTHCILGFTINIKSCLNKIYQL